MTEKRIPVLDLQQLAELDLEEDPDIKEYTRQMEQERREYLSNCPEYTD